jgi:hypothetical protein
MGGESMSAEVAELISRLHEAGGELVFEDGGIKVRAPAPLPDDFMAELRRHKTELVNKLSGDNLTPDQEAAITRWLDHIDEADPALRAECLDRCRQDPEALAYYLERAREVPDEAGSAVRARLLRGLEADPGLVRAIELIDPDADPLRLIVAIRGIGTCELHIAVDRWDPMRFLELVESTEEAVS